MAKHKSQQIPKPLLFIFVFMVAVFLFSLFLFSKLLSLNNKLNNSDKDTSLLKVVKDTSLATNTIFVDIEGAVAKPGVYELPGDSRLIDALIKAEGLVKTADRYQLARNFNLAKKLTDEEKIYIPFLEEQHIFVPDSLSLNFISINTASQTQLELLPGIGSVTAKKIIDNRPYSTVEELLVKKVLSEKTYEKIKDQLVL